MMKRILVYGFATLLPLLVVVYFYSYYNNQNPFSIKCIFHEVTGLWCPGCGGQRAFSLLAHGHILQSLRYNLLLPFALYICAQLYYSIIGNIFLGKTMSGNLHLPTSFARNFLIFLLVYSILRNIPLSPFVYLAPES
ncbi:DUF2752 domain-containing protein [Empedobacter tilapiae]|uniref:DUF2752 domain-containing protein n=1 Tax=Empedobacter tilapiae TaxID=2491114 RepID=UPI0028D621D1|nr:DUF2752 domain-containing protein [Empedobacter tilapiae]